MLWLLRSTVQKIVRLSLMVLSDILLHLPCHNWMLYSNGFFWPYCPLLDITCLHFRYYFLCCRCVSITSRAVLKSRYDTGYIQVVLSDALSSSFRISIRFCASLFAFSVDSPSRILRSKSFTFYNLKFSLFDVCSFHFFVSCNATRTLSYSSRSFHFARSLLSTWLQPHCFSF